MASDPRRGDAPRRPRSHRPGSTTTTAAIALAVLASACTQTHVVLEPALDAGAGDTALVPATLAVSAGQHHACAIADGALYCWGKNDDGRLGLGDTNSPRPNPEQVGTGANWAAVATGETSTLALKTDGTIWSFGGNDWGQLGQGDVTKIKTSPFQIGERADWKAIAIRFNHACALARDGALWCWGENDEGQLGQSDMAPPKDSCGPRSTDAICRAVLPTRVPSAHGFVAVDAGQGHTCAIATDGTLWCWGRNSSCELAQECENGAIIQFRKPVRVGNTTDWKLVRSGQNTTCGVRGDAAYCWGQSVTDEGGVDMGIPGVAPGAKVSTVTDIGVHRVADLSFNTFGGVARDDKGGAWVWGRNREGQFGMGDKTPRSGVVPLDSSGWTQVSAGRFATCGVREGSPVCAGQNDAGQLGKGDLSDSPSFMLVRLPPQ